MHWPEYEQLIIEIIGVTLIGISRIVLLGRIIDAMLGHPFSWYSIILCLYVYVCGFVSDDEVGQLVAVV